MTKKNRYLAINFLSWSAWCVIARYTTLDGNHLPQHPFDVIVWIFILMGIWSFWSGCFKFLDWYNGKI